MKLLLLFCSSICCWYYECNYGVIWWTLLSCQWNLCMSWWWWEARNQLRVTISCSTASTAASIAAVSSPLMTIVRHLNTCSMSHQTRHISGTTGHHRGPLMDSSLCVSCKLCTQSVFLHFYVFGGLIYAYHVACCCLLRISCELLFVEALLCATLPCAGLVWCRKESGYCWLIFKTYTCKSVDL